MVREFGFWLVFLLTAAGFGSRGCLGDEIPKVHVAFTLEEVALPVEAGAYFRARFDFSWDAQEIPDFSVDAIRFFNAVNVDALQVQRVTGGPRRPVGLGGSSGHGAILVTGNFKTYSNYADFPFDTHEIGILLYLEGVAEGEIELVSAAADLNTDFAFPGLSDGLVVRSIQFYADNSALRDSVPSDSADRELAFCGVTLQISRSFTPNFVRILLPMGIIWALSYLSHFWRDSSPASRFSGASMIAAIALTLGVRGFIPPFNYLMAINVSFLGLYFCIAFDAITTAAAFHERGAGRPERADRLRIAAIIVSPILAFFALTSSWWVATHEVLDPLFDRAPDVSKTLDELN